MTDAHKSLVDDLQAAWQRMIGDVFKAVCRAYAERPANGDWHAVEAAIAQGLSFLTAETRHRLLNDVILCFKRREHAEALRTVWNWVVEDDSDWWLRADAQRDAVFRECLIGKDFAVPESVERARRRLLADGHNSNAAPAEPK
jgi:hypothetical protein